MSDNIGKGALWNNKRRTSERSPDFTGTVTIEGAKYFISGWKSHGGGGSPDINLTVAPHKDQPTSKQPFPVGDITAYDGDDDLDF